MRDRASRTAAWVAGCRGLGHLLGAAQIADDPYGLQFAGRGFTLLGRLPGMQRWVTYMQVRTRAIDDELLGFAGDQVVILGAGYDARAARFERELRGTTVFEIDHPATQARKRDVLPETGAVYVPWDFERRPVSELPDELAARGLDLARPTLVLWEGVTMYLSEAAIEATFAALRRLRARLVFTYIERRRITGKRAFRSLLTAIGEPWRFGWDPAALPGWLAARGFTLERDQAETALARQLLPAELARHVAAEGRHIAVATVSG